LAPQLTLEDEDDEDEDVELEAVFDAGLADDEDEEVVVVEAGGVTVTGAEGVEGRTHLPLRKTNPASQAHSFPTKEELGGQTGAKSTCRADEEDELLELEDEEAGLLEAEAAGAEAVLELELLD
jgi:hypothetical protein